MVDTPLTVLMVDDQASRRSLVRSVLLDGRVCQRVLEAEDGVVGLKLAMTEKVDLIITDLVMPRLDGQAFIRAVRAKSNQADLPIIMLTRKDGVADKVAALEAGANDYVVTPVEPPELLARARTQLRIKFLQDQLKARTAELEHLATTDHLTGLTNRKRFTDLAAVELKKANRYGAPLGLLLADLDPFKPLVEAKGHAEAERLLQDLGLVIRRTLRDTDLVARYEPESLVILLPMTALPGTLCVAERVRRAAESTVLPTGGPMTVSVGITHVPTHGMVPHLDALVEGAQRGVQAARDHGGNRVATGLATS